MELLGERSLGWATSLWAEQEWTGGAGHSGVDVMPGGGKAGQPVSSGP